MTKIRKPKEKKRVGLQTVIPTVEKTDVKTQPQPKKQETPADDNSS